jgi:hypothetical protein
LGWNRSPTIFWGALLVLIGVLFLLGNTGVLNNVNWDVVWPVFLIALGVWLIATRFGPGGSISDVDSSDIRDGLARARLEIAVGSARLNVRTAALGEQLYRVHLGHAGSRPEIRLDRTTGILRISQSYGWFPGAGRLRVEAELSDAIPWDLSCSTGAIRGEFELTGGQLSGFECKTGASLVDLRLPAPKGLVPIRLEGGALTVEVTRPVGSAVKVRVSAGAVQLNADGTRQDGLGSREWRSSGYDSAADRYDVTVSGGAANVTVGQV